MLQVLRFWTPMGHIVHGDRRWKGCWSPVSIRRPRVPRFVNQKFAAWGQEPALHVLEVLPKIMQFDYLPSVIEVPSTNSLPYLAWLFTRKERDPRAECQSGLLRHYASQANPRRLQLGVIPDGCYGLPVCLWYFRAGMLNSWSDQVLERSEVLWLPSFLGALALRQEHLLHSSCPSICPHISARFPLDGFLLRFGIDNFCENLPKNCIFR